MSIHKDSLSMLARSMPEMLRAVRICLETESDSPGSCLGYPAGTLLCCTIDALGAWHMGDDSILVEIDGRSRPIDHVTETFYILRSELFDLQIDDNGEFELLLGPEKPQGHTGNFICTVKGPNKRDPGGEDRYATFISGRQLFYDWENEQAIHLTITNLDRAGDHPPALTPAKCAAELRHMGSIVNGHMQFWLDFYDKILNVNGSHGSPEDGKYYYPENGYNKPNCASSDTGGGMSTNVYAGGLYDLAEDEALYIEATYTGDPVYVSVHLGNLWGESPDYANHQSSLNLHQMYMGEDRVQRWVVAHRDPGVQNWLDTTGLPRGYLSHRWAYSEIPDEKDWPTIKAEKIRLDQVADYMPQDMPRLSGEERRQAIRVRQAHVQRRYRVF